MSSSNAATTSLGKIQVQVSRGSIDLLVRSTYEDINNLRMKNERFQKRKRAEDDRRRRERYAEIQQEAISSGKRNAALEMKWSELKDLEECEELFDEIQQQQDAFGQITNGKEELRKEFEDELKRKDDEYVKMIKEQSNDVKDLIVKMRSQFHKIRDANLLELQDIEQQFEQQRSNLLKEFNTEITKTFEKHASIERECVEQHTINEEENTKSIEDLRIKGQKHYAELKITMETEIQDLEKCFEDMKALYQLITEKLDYSLKVLQEKFHENNSLCDELKRRENNYKNRLKQLTKDYKQYDKKFKLENKSLTQEYKRIIRQFKELQKKFKHFEKADLEKYSEIQKMNEAEVKELKEKIVKGNITIHVQQLGMQWESNASEEEQPNEPAAQSPEGENEEDAEVELCVSEEKLEEIIAIVLEEADFLIDDKLREELEYEPGPTQISQKLECIKKCLHIESVDEMNIFLRDLITICRVKSQSELEQQARQQLLLLGIIKEHDLEGQVEEEDGEGDATAPKNPGEHHHKKEEAGTKKDDKTKNPADIEKKNHGSEGVAGEGAELEIGEDGGDFAEDVEVEVNLETAEINVNDVVKFIQEWQSNTEKRKEKLEKESSRKAAKQESERDKKERIAREGKKYWEKLTQVLPDRTFRVWGVLDTSLSKYYELLLDRQKLIEETSELHNQNEELKNLLNQYIQIDHELIIRPTRLINIDTGAQ